MEPHGLIPVHAVPVYSKYGECITLFKRLIGQSATLSSNWEDELGRLRLFAGQTFLLPQSIEDKLRNTSHVLNKIADLLEDLRNTLQTCKLSS